MTDAPANAEEKIVVATIECIEKYGFSGATNRRIAQEAGVNIAAINYYFRSKEALIQRVMEMTLTNAFDLSDIPPMPGATGEEYCQAVFFHILRGGLQYPGITRAHFYQLLAEGQSDPLLAGYVHRFVDALAGEVEGRGAGRKREEVKMALAQIFSAVTVAALAPGLFEGVDMHDEEVQREYVRKLVGGLI